VLAAYVETPNFADPLAALIVGERPEPETHAGWTRVTLEAASLNRHDVWTLQGVTQHPTLPLPMILGCDGAGRLDDGTEVMLYPVIPGVVWRRNTRRWMQRLQRTPPRHHGRIRCCSAAQCPPKTGTPFGGGGGCAWDNMANGLPHAFRTIGASAWCNHARPRRVRRG
jgi:hypothetical protein